MSVSVSPTNGQGFSGALSGPPDPVFGFAMQFHGWFVPDFVFGAVVAFLLRTTGA
jgi:hypothetical protein